MGCNIYDIVSRVCNRGTKGCIVDHKAERVISPLDGMVSRLGTLRVDENRILSTNELADTMRRTHIFEYVVGAPGAKSGYRLTERGSKLLNL